MYRSAMDDMAWCINPCFVDEGASSGWSDRARPWGRPRILPCCEYLHDTLIHLLVWRNPCFVGIWSCSIAEILKDAPKGSLNPCFVGKKIWKSKVFCSALSLDLTIEMSTGHFFILVLLGYGLVEQQGNHNFQRCPVLILVLLGCDNLKDINLKKTSGVLILVLLGCDNWLQLIR